MIRRLSFAVLLLLALAFWGAFNILQHRAWFEAARENQAAVSGGFSEVAPDLQPLPDIYLDHDSLYWLHLAGNCLENSAWRPRWTDWDNVPHGRPNHWSSPLVWLMAGTARIAALFSDRSSSELLSLTAPWINPALFVLLLLATAFLLARRLGPVVAGLLVLSLATLPPIMRSFSTLHIDHHGLIDIPALWMSLLLFLGLTSAAPEKQRRAWFQAAGAVGGIGLWLQASHQLILIAGTLGGLLLWVLFTRPPLPGKKQDTKNEWLNAAAWRGWAAAGAVVSIATWLLEYAPAHLGMQLDVNHPLYALSWYGATEAILAIAQARRNRQWTRNQLAILAAGALPALITLLLMHRHPGDWLAVASPFLQRIHSQIGEFKPLLGSLGNLHPILLFFLFNSLPLVALAGVLLWTSSKTPLRERIVLHLALLALIPAFILCLRHARYSSLLAATFWQMAVAACLALRAADVFRLRRIVPPLLAVGAAASLLGTLSPLRNSQVPFMPVERWASQMVMRDVARELAAVPGFSNSAAVCPTSLAAPLQVLANVQTTGGLYWENNDGLQAAADLYTSVRDDDALRLLRERGIRWIIVETQPGFARQWSFDRFGTDPAPDPRVTLAGRLASGQRLPAWLTPVNPATLPLATQARYALYRVND